MSEFEPDDAIFATLETEPQPRKRRTILPWLILVLLISLAVGGLYLVQQKMAPLAVMTTGTSAPTSSISEKELAALQRELAELREDMLMAQEAPAPIVKDAVSSDELKSLENEITLLDKEIERLHSELDGVYAELDRVSELSLRAPVVTAAPKPTNNTALLQVKERFDAGRALGDAVSKLKNAPQALLYYKDRAPKTPSYYYARWEAIMAAPQETPNENVSLWDSILADIAGLVEVKKLDADGHAMEEMVSLGELANEVRATAEATEDGRAWLADVEYYLAARDALQARIDAAIEQEGN